MTATLAWNAPEMSQKSWENSHKRFTAERSREEMRRHLRVIAGVAGEANRKAALAFVSRVLDLPYWRVSEIFYGRAHRIDAHEADRIRAYIEQAQHLIEANAKLEAQRRAFLAEAPEAVARHAPGPLEIPEIDAEGAAPVARKAAR